MWLSKQMRPAPATADADLGVTTIAGDSVGVITRGEVRNLPVYGPGGYLWTPGAGAAVLVVKGGPGGEEQCVAGSRPLNAPASVRPGEVFLYGPGGNSIYLKGDGGVEIRGGTVSITGNLTVNGQPWQAGHADGG
ncbi:hypothetical protein AALC17_07775 [Oscillospiraceae bacterium 38-13]